MKRKLIKNSISGLGQAVINLILVFFTIPVFIKMLGNESYGIFALIMVIGSLNSLTNLGLNNALVKFIAEQGRTIESNTDIIVALLMLIALIIPITIIALYFNKFIITDVLNVPDNKFYLAKGLYIWLLLANDLLLIGQVFKAVLDGLQKIYVTSVIQVIYNLLYWGLILAVLLLGFNLPAIGLSIFVAAFVWLLITLIYTLKEWGRISFEGFQGNFKTSIKKLLNYGLLIYSGGLIGFFYEPLSKILISNFIGVPAVGFYDIAVRLKGQIWGFILKIFYPLFPFISETKNKEVVRKYVHDLEQKTFLIIAPMIAVVILLMHPFIAVWLGNNVEIISITAIFIISFHLVGSTVIPNYQFLMAKDWARKTVILQLSNVVFNALFFLLTVNYIGYYALIVGNVAAILSSFILSLYYQKKYLNSLIFDSFSQLLKLILSFTILVSVGYLIKTVLNGHTILIFMVIPVILAIITLLCYKVFGLVNQEDIYRYFGKNNIISISLVKIFNRS